MEEVSTAFANAYRSQRLVYRDIEINDKDMGIMHNFGAANHVSWGLVSGPGRLFRDVSKKANLEQLGKLLENDLLLKVLICLPAEETDEVSKLGVGDRGAKERENATVIGNLFLDGVGGTIQALTTSVGLNLAEEYHGKVRST